MAKNTRTYWYNYLDISRILNTKSDNGPLYHVEDATSQNIEQLTQAVSRAIATLQLNTGQTAAVIPINLGRSVQGVYHGSHWVGVVIRRDAQNNLEAFYNDSIGMPMDYSLPALRRILTRHEIPEERITDFQTVQQNNGYDCGAWTVLNLDSIATTGNLPTATEGDVIVQRREEFGYVHGASESLEHGRGPHAKEETKEAPDNVKEPIKVVFSGHRGYGASQVQPQREDGQLFPENSLISFQKVMKSGAESIEFDLYLSQDKHLMVVHDDDLAINAHYILQERDRGKAQDAQGGYHPVGAKVPIVAGKTLVTKIPAGVLRKEYDISKGLRMPDKLLESEEHLYKTIPEFQEVLKLVVTENARRAGSDLPRIILNIELKGHNTGLHVQKVIDDFNAPLAPAVQIKQEEIYYMSFLSQELAAIAGFNVQDGSGHEVRTVAPNPSANLILGVPTNVQYINVDPNYAIGLPPTLNRQALKNWVENLHGALKGLQGRGGKGLTGVDLSMWDVLDPSVEYFCKGLGLPIHIAVTPYGPKDLIGPHVNTALRNIEKISITQGKYLTGEHTMLVKTDNPNLLQNIIQEFSASSQSMQSFSVEGPVKIRKAGLMPAIDTVVEREVVEASGLTFHEKPPALIKKAQEEEAKKREEELRQREEEALRKAAEKPSTTDDNTTGKGSASYENVSYWNEYSNSSMKKILELRLKSTDINIEHIKIIHPNYIFNEVTLLTFIKDLVTQIDVADIETGSGIRPKLLIPVNIDNKHWVGMVIEFTNDRVVVTYMDSEAHPMPKSLNDGLKAELERSYHNSIIEIIEKEVEHQKYNNCGLEVIENLIAAVAEETISIDQEETLAMHSILYEQYLIEKALQETGSRGIYEVGQDSTTKELSDTHQTSWEKEMNKMWNEAQDSNLGEEELRIMDAIWNQSQVHGTETTEGETRLSGVKNSISQSLSSLVSINPNDIISSLHSMAQLLSTGSSSRCGVEINTPGESVPERLDTFTTNSTNVFGMPLRNGNMLSSETLSLREPMQTIGSVDESWAE